MYPPATPPKKKPPLFGGSSNPDATTNSGFTPPPVAPGMPTGGFVPPGAPKVEVGGGFNNGQATTNGGVRLGDPSAPQTTNAMPPPVDTAPGTTNTRVGGAPAPAAAVAPAAPTGFAPGWQDAGNGMARNPATGQLLPLNHPAYQALLAAGPDTAPPLSDAPPPAAPGAPGAAAPGMPMTAGDVTGTTAPGQPGAPPTSIAQSFQQALISRLNPQAVTADDPSIKGSIQANKLAEQRGVEAQRNRLAEQAARSGTAGGGTDAMQRGIVADSAARQGQYAGDAVQHQSDLNHQDLLAALGLGGSFLQQNATRDQQGNQFGQSLAEQRRQFDQDAELRRLGITTQSSLGQGDLSLRQRLGEGGLNNQLLGLLLNNQQFGQQLGQQNNQFGQSLGQSGILGLLGLL